MRKIMVGYCNDEAGARYPYAQIEFQLLAIKRGLTLSRNEMKQRWEAWLP